MEGRLDFSGLERGRILGSSLPSGSLSSLGAAYQAGESGHSAALSRLGASAAAVNGVPELARPGSPTAMAAIQGQYQNRYLAPSSALHSPGASYAMMTSYLAAAGHTPEALKAVLPEYQQCWSSAHAEGYTRYLMNSMLYPYLPYMPATESLSMFAQNSATAAQAQAAAQHRIYDLHKEAMLSGVAAGYYGGPAALMHQQSGQIEATNLSLPSSSKSKQNDTLGTSSGKARQSDKPRQSDIPKKSESTSKSHSISKSEQCPKSTRTDLTKNCSGEMPSKRENTCDSKHSPERKSGCARTNTEYSSGDKRQTTEKHRSEKEPTLKPSVVDSSERPHECKCSSAGTILKRTLKARSPVDFEERKDCLKRPSEICDRHGSDKRSVCVHDHKNENMKHQSDLEDPKETLQPLIDVQDKPENLCVKDRRKADLTVAVSTCSKTQSIVTDTTVTVTSTIGTSSPQTTTTSCGGDEKDEATPTDLSDKGSSQHSPGGSARTTTTYSLPYYHNLYSRTQTPSQDGKKIYATTYVPEVGTVPSCTISTNSVSNSKETVKSDKKRTPCNVTNDSSVHSPGKHKGINTPATALSSVSSVSSSTNRSNKSKHVSGQQMHPEQRKDSHSNSDEKASHEKPSQKSGERVSVPFEICDNILKGRDQNFSTSYQCVEKISSQNSKQEEKGSKSKCGPSQSPNISAKSNEVPKENKGGNGDTDSNTIDKTNKVIEIDANSKVSCPTNVKHKPEKNQKTNSKPKGQKSAFDKTVLKTDKVESLTKPKTLQNEKPVNKLLDNCDLNHNSKVDCDDSVASKVTEKKDVEIKTSALKSNATETPIAASPSTHRPGSAPPSSAVFTEVDKETDKKTEQEVPKVDDSKKKKPKTKSKDVNEETSSGQNIPVGIAVARQRPVVPKPETSGESTMPLNHQVDHDVKPSSVSQPRPLKVIRPATKTNHGACGNELPANLIVTGGTNTGTGVFWPDDPASRQFAAQFLQGSHGINSGWFPQGHIPYPQSSTGSVDGGQLPLSVPSGYKLAQDSITGQILLISSDVCDQNRIWTMGAQPPQQGGHQTFSPQVITGQLPNTLPPGQGFYSGPQQITDRHAGVDFLANMPQCPVIFNPAAVSRPEAVIKEERTEEETHGGNTCSQDSPLTMGSVTTLAHSGDGGIKDRVVAVAPSHFVQDMPMAGQQCGYQFSQPSVPILFNHTVVPLQNVGDPTVENNAAKAEITSVQSRGTSPMLPANECSDENEETASQRSSEGKLDSSEVDILDEDTEEENKIQQHEDRNANTETHLDETCFGHSEKNSKCDKSEGVEIDKMLGASSGSKSGSIVTQKDTGGLCKVASAQEKGTIRCDEDSDISGKKCVEMKDTDDIPHPTANEHVKEPPVPKTCTLDDLVSVAIAENTKLSENGNSSKTSSKGTLFYNPYTDPQILQAADGLELLSALAEKRSEKDIPSNKLLSQKVDSTFRTESSLTNDIYTFQDDAESYIPPKEKKVTEIKCKTKRQFNLKDLPKSRVKAGYAFQTKKAEPPQKPVRYTTFCGIRIPEDDEMIDSMEMEMRMRLAELQRKYKEKQRELAKLKPKKDKDELKRNLQRGPGRPRKRKGGGEDSDKNLGSDGRAKQGKKDHGPPKKKKLAEMLVDRVFRKAGNSFKIPLSKKASLIAPARIEFPPCNVSSQSEKAKTTSSKVKASVDLGKLIKRSRLSKLNGKDRSFVGGFWRYKEHFNDGRSANLHLKPKKVKKEEPACISQTGLGLLAECASRPTVETPEKKSVEKKKKKRKMENEIDDSLSSPDSPNKKRKPGRPKKINPNTKPGVTETIVAKQSKHLDFFRWQQMGSDNETDIKASERTISLEGQTPLKPLYIDEWTIRRSERIFLSDSSPQTSPNLTVSPASTVKSRESNSTERKSCKPKANENVVPTQTKMESATNKDRKIQRSKQIQDISQKLKKKYSKGMNSKKTTELLKASRDKLENKRKQKVMVKKSNSESDSEGDDLPLSSLKSRPTTPEPKSCKLTEEDLVDGKRVLLFTDGLFYEGMVKAIRPPDVYGVILDNERRNRTHIYSQQELLQDAVAEVKPGSSRFLPEGRRICAYWSQQFSCLYPGTVAKGSPDQSDNDKSLVNVEFDDGDSGKISVDHIRLLSQDFPHVEYDPNPPLLLLTTRRRYTTTLDFSEPRRSFSDLSTSSKDSKEQKDPKTKRGPGRPPKFDRSKSEDPSLTRHFDDEEVFSDDNDSGRKKKSSKESVNGDVDGSNEEGETSSDEDAYEEEYSCAAKRYQALLPGRQLWTWSGKSTKRPGMKGKAKKEYYKSIVRGSETIMVGDCAVFLSTGRPNLPYVGKIESLWEGWGGQMVVKVKWFYHPEETKGGKRLSNMKGALFRSDHEDENDVQTISHRCDVLSYSEYKRKKGVISTDHCDNVYYLAGSYQPTIGLIKFEPGVIS